MRCVGWFVVDFCIKCPRLCQKKQGAQGIGQELAESAVLHVEHGHMLVEGHLHYRRHTRRAVPDECFGGGDVGLV